MNNTELWEFKYAPKSFDEMILEDKTKLILKECLKTIPNMTIAGSPGIGKGTFMDILMKQEDIEVYRINGSDETSVNDVRDKIAPFAESMGFVDILNIVYINEADRLSPHAMDMLRDLIEKVHDITRFILLCNHPERISKEILSRCPLLIIKNPPIKEIAEKCIYILKEENITYKTQDVINIVKSTYPDIRHAINMLKYNIVDGELLSDFNIVSIDQVYDDIFDCMMKGDPSALRSLLRSCVVDYTQLYEFLYKKIMDSKESITKNDITFICELAEASYRNDIVSIKEIAFMGFYINIIGNGCL